MKITGVYYYLFIYFFWFLLRFNIIYFFLFGNVQWEM